MGSSVFGCSPPSTIVMESLDFLCLGCLVSQKWDCDIATVEYLLCLQASVLW